MINKKNLNKKVLSVFFLIIIFVLIAGFSFAKFVNQTIIKASGQIANPILEIENGTIVDINNQNQSVTCNFKIKNYNTKNEITNTDLKYYIEILPKVKNSISIELLQNGKLISLNNGKTDYIKMQKNIKQTDEYKVNIKYDSSNTSYQDISQKLKIKVHAEQVKK